MDTELQQAIDAEITVEAETQTPVCFSKTPPQAGQELIYYYKDTSDGRLVLKIHFPPDWKPTDSRPCTVFFHGGGWRSSEPDKIAEQFEICCSHLCARGIVTVNAQYRGINRIGPHVEYCVEDAKSAMRWVRSRAEKLGIDPERIASGGGSAGGHLATAVFTTNGCDADTDDLSISPKPNLLLLFNPALDTEFRAENFGSPDLALICSPLHNLSSTIPPALILFGTADKMLNEGRQFMKSARELGLKAELWTADGQKHAFFNKQPWQNATIKVTEQFLQKYGYIQGPPTMEPEPGIQMELLEEVP
jgi:acetyl esterase